MRRKLLGALLYPHCPEPRRSPSGRRRPRSPHRLLVALLPPALLLAGCQDRELPTAVAPEGAAFDHQSGSCEVSNTQDSGEGSLRHAIETATCATITFDASVEVIGLTSGPLTINRDLTITGPSAVRHVFGNGVLVSGRYASRVFAITAGTTVTLSGVTIFGGSADNGGGILNDGTLTLTNSIIADNSADNSGGGAIFNFAGLLTLTHSTVAANGAADGGGIANLWFGTARLRNTIVANWHSGGNCYGPIDDLGYNLDSGTSCGFSAENQSLSSTDPRLDDPYHNGGPTPTPALTAGSPAIDAGTCTDHAGATVSTDQRGISRPQGSGCDIGAFELEPASTPVFGGFLPPVRQEQLNVVKAGSALPVKFSLGGDFGLEIFAADYPTSVQIACPPASMARNSVSGTTSARASRLTYDAEDNQYNYLWVTQKGWAGSCRQFQLQLRDGGTYTLDFSFTR